jgi:hypothetical protein
MRYTSVRKRLLRLARYRLPHRHTRGAPQGTDHTGAWGRGAGAAGEVAARRAAGPERKGSKGICNAYLYWLHWKRVLACLFSSRRMSIMSRSVDTTLGKFVDHLIQGFTPEVAKHFAELPKPNPEFQARLDELAEKANEGTLSPEEAKEYDKYVEYMDFIALMRLKARLRVSTLPNV